MKQCETCGNGQAKRKMADYKGKWYCRRPCFEQLLWELPIEDLRRIAAGEAD